MLAGKTVHRDIDRLPRRHVLQLGFLVIGDHIGLCHRHHRQQRQTRHHILLAADLALAHYAVERRADRCVIQGILGQGQVGLGLAHPGLGFGDPRLRLLAARLQHLALGLLPGHLGTGFGHRCQCLGPPGAGGFQALAGGDLLIHQIAVALEVQARTMGLGLAAMQGSLGLGDTLLLLVEPCVESGQAGLAGVRRRPGLLQPCLGAAQLLDKITLIQAHQHIPGLDRLVVLHQHLGHIAGNPRADGDPIGAHVGVVGLFQKSPQLPPIRGKQPRPQQRHQ